MRSLLGWNADGEIVATLDYVVARDEHGKPAGLVDFAAHEDAGGRMRDIWEVRDGAGSGTWPEWLGGKAHEFKVELHDSPAPARARINALVHKTSGHRRERADIESTIRHRQLTARNSAADIRDIVGGPGHPLALDADGRTTEHKVISPRLPLIENRPSHEGS